MVLLVLKCCLVLLQCSLSCVFYRLTDQYEQASLHLWELLEGRDKAVAGTTCKCSGSWASPLSVSLCFVFDPRPSLLQTSPWRTLYTRCCTAVTLIERRLIRMEPARRRRNRRSHLQRRSPRMGRSHQKPVRNDPSVFGWDFSLHAPESP